MHHAFSQVLSSKGGPVIYVSLYVDDFLYFSTDEATEKEFERRILEDTP